MTKQAETPKDLTETDLDDAEGGMLLPAVQAAREAARSKSTPTATLSTNKLKSR